MWNRGSKVWNVENVFIKTVFGSIFPCALATRYPGNFFDMHIKKKKKKELRKQVLQMRKYVHNVNVLIIVIIFDFYQTQCSQVCSTNSFVTHSLINSFIYKVIL
jgi:hypothetical protein